MKILRSMSLKNKAAFFIAAILVAVIGLSTLFLSMTMVPRFRKALLLSASLVGEGLVKDIKKTVDMGIPLASLDGLGDKLTETVSQYPDLGYICVTDDEGVILYRSQQMGDRLGSRLGTVIGASEGSPGSAPLVRIGGTGFYDVAMPIASGEGTVGSVHVGLKSQVVSSQVNAVLYPSMGIGLVSFLLATVLIVTFVNRFISAPLEGLSVTARKISHGDLASPPTVARRDEIGQLAEAFTVMVGSLSDIIGQSRSTSNSMEKSAAELAQIVGNLTDAFGRQVAKLDEVGLSINEMDSLARNLTEQSRNLSQSAVESSSSVMETMSAIGEINHNMSEITSAVENISSSMLEMSTTIREVAAGAESMASMAEETRAAVSRINDGIQNMRQTADKSRVLSEDVKKNALEGGSRAVRETLKGIVSIQEDVRQAENAMKALQDRASSISEIISVIDDIADQTNLLALNASIIAAQAGDQGRSFAVVAQEIRDLSVRTSESTRKISALIKGVQQEAAHSSASQARVIESVQKGLKLGQEAEKSLELITGSADESAKMASLIAKATGEQAEASQRVSDSVAVFSRSAEEIKKATREEAKTSEFIKDSMEKTKRMIEMVNRATEEQNRGSRLLAESSEKAKEVSQEVLTATDMERQLAGSIAGAVAALKEISHQNLQLVKTISVSSELLTGLSASLRKELDKFSTQEAGVR